jgi:hypothetical protein
MPVAGGLLILTTYIDLFVDGLAQWADDKPRQMHLYGVNPMAGLA